LINGVYNAVGTPGTALTGGPTGTALDTVLAAVATLYNNDCPVADGQLSEYNTPNFNNKLASNNRTLFNPTKEIGEIYLKGLQGEFADSMHFVNQLVLPHTNGNSVGTPVVATTTVNPASTANVFPRIGTLATSGWTATVATLNVGDIFTVAGVNMVNPQSKQDLLTLQQFVVTAPVTSDGGGLMSVSYSPAMTSAGPYQNVTAQAQAGAAIVTFGAAGVTTQNAWVMHRNALMLANKDLDLPKGVDFADYIKDPETEIGIRYVRAFDIRVNQIIDRFDSMVALATLYEQLACRIATT